ncbi:hypothetical protein Tco_0078559 [Tanacetum coccineum]
MVFNSPCLADKKELIHHEGTALGDVMIPTKGLALLRVVVLGKGLIKLLMVAAVVPKSVAGSDFLSLKLLGPAGTLLLELLVTPQNQVLVVILSKNQRAEDDGDDAYFISLDSRLICDEGMTLIKAKEVEFWVKKGFSASSGSDGSIRRMQVMNTAY